MLALCICISHSYIILNIRNVLLGTKHYISSSCTYIIQPSFYRQKTKMDFAIQPAVDPLDNPNPPWPKFSFLILVCLLKLGHSTPLTVFYWFGHNASPPVTPLFRGFYFRTDSLFCSAWIPFKKRDLRNINKTEAVMRAEMKEITTELRRERY